jgi:histidine triad (HIT) family protein
VGSSVEDIFYRDAHLTGLISLHSWQNNRGNAILIPNAHYENLYDLPDEIGARIHALARRVALAMKAAYGCDGISTRQHNEPAGNQDVFHYHLHVFPRYTGDNLYQSPRSPEPAPAEERRRFAGLLRQQLERGPNGE